MQQSQHLSPLSLSLCPPLYHKGTFNRQSTKDLGDSASKMGKHFSKSPRLSRGSELIIFQALPEKNQGCAVFWAQPLEAR